MNIFVKHTFGTIVRIATGLILLCMLLGAWAGWIAPSTWAIPAILCLVFPIMWFAIFFLGVLWLIFGSKKYTAIVCGAFLIVTFPQFLNVSPLSTSSDLKVGEKQLRLLTYNVANAVDMDSVKLGYSRSLSYVINSGADIVCLQEFFGINSGKNLGSQITQAQMDSLHAVYPYHIGGQNLEDKVYSKYPAKSVSGINWKARKYFNYLLCKVNMDGYEMHIINVHLPSYSLSKQQQQLASDLKNNPGTVIDENNSRSLYRKLRDAFITRARAAHDIARIIDSIPGPVIVCGDFNDVPNSYTWRTIKSAGMKDAYTEAGFGPMVTFNDNHFLFHIDQVLYRPKQGMRVLDISHGKSLSSDHYPLMVNFAVNPQY